jgi:carboxylesterase type B
MNLPVLFFVHGGGFISGSGLVYEGYKWMDYDIVLAVPNYRLGPIGNNISHKYTDIKIFFKYRFPFAGH